MVIVSDNYFRIVPQETKKFLKNIKIRQSNWFSDNRDSKHKVERSTSILAIKHSQMLVMKSFGISRLEHKIRKNAKIDILSMVVFIKLLHLFGNKQNNISLFGYVIGKLLVFVVSYQFSHIFAFKEEVVIFAECHKQVSNVLPLISAKFDAVKVSFGYFELIANILHYFSRFEIQ